MLRNENKYLGPKGTKPAYERLANRQIAVYNDHMTTMREIKAGLKAHQTATLEAALWTALDDADWCQSRAADELEMPLSTLRWEIARCPELAGEMAVRGKGAGRPTKGMT